jgi:hypothetical protein
MPDAEVEALLVTIHVTAPSELIPTFRDPLLIQMIDMAPDCEKSTPIIEQYLEVPGAIVEVFHDDPKGMEPTHLGTEWRQ